MSKQDAFSKLIAKATELIARGEGQRVVDLCQKFHKKQPENYDVLHLAGVGYRLVGRLDKAIEYYQRALRLRPQGSATLFCNYAFACLESPDVSVVKAEKYANEAIKLAPELPDAYEVSTEVALRIGDISAAETHIRKALDLKPDAPVLLAKLAKVYRQAFSLDQALEVVSQAVAIAPTVAQVVREKADVHEARGETELAITAYEQAKHLSNENVEEIEVKILGVLSTHGRGQELKDRALRIIDEDKKNLFATLALLRMGEYPGGAEAGMIAVRRQRKGNSTRVMESFAIADAFDKEKNYAESFRHYSAGNREKLSRSPKYSIQDTRKYYDRLRQYFKETPQVIPTFTGGDEVTPVFIVGMPRSGTSLLEQLLGCHSEIHAAGELLFLPSLVRFGDYEFRNHQRQQDSSYWRWVRQCYLGTITKLADGKKFVVDKMPHNYEQIGFIREVFPEAIVIHSHRNAVSNCMSLFKANFAGHHPYAQDLKTLGMYYGEYRKLMRYWKQRYGDAIIDSKYEDLVADMQPSVTKLLDVMGLDWEPGIEDFHKVDRIVRTASNDQVRQPIYQSSIKGWKSYEPYIGPLLGALKETGEVAQSEVN